jgi:D-beta-D-heptose 7-phosphate kinase/D-beta-D-heptose 1-phosphate adenosyltransferase
MDTANLIALTRQPPPCRLVVVGDLMLDRYVWGSVSRVSPEAPIPVLKLERETEMPGGAASVVLNLRELGADVVCCGVVGTDEHGDRLLAALADAGADTKATVATPSRATTVKTRYIGAVQSAARAMQHVLRVDREDTSAIDAATVEQLFAEFETALPTCQAVLISDYGKGLLTDALLARVIEAARATGKPVLVDPRLGDNIAAYRGATAITPNRLETERATGIAPRDPESMAAAAQKLIDTLNLDFAIITVDRDGMYLHAPPTVSLLLPSRPRSVYDVSGAGDIVLSVLGFFLAGGASREAAATLANVAAGIEVGKLGVATVSHAEMRSELMTIAPDAADKLKELDELDSTLESHRNRNEKIVFTNGCFDMLHVGHMKYLSFAREQGDLLVVALNSDASIRRLKGERRPILEETERVRLVGALSCVDYIVIFDDDSVLPTIEHVRPDVLVKGGDYGLDGVVGRDFVEAAGGAVVLAPEIEGISTSTIVERVLEKYGAQPDPRDDG